MQTDCKSIEGKRWLDGGYLASNIAVITEEVAAITTKQLVKFIFLRSGKSRLYMPGGDSDGVGVITGRDDQGLLGWSERCVRPRVFVYQYNNPLDLKILKGEALMEYRSLAFSHDKFLLGITGIPDFMVNLWDWQEETLLTSVSTELEGPSSANVKLISSAFPPDSGIGMSKMFLSLWAGKISVWDIEKVSDSYNIKKNNLDLENIVTFTWAFPSDVYLLAKTADMYRVDPTTKTVYQMILDLKLQSMLNDYTIKPCEFNLKAHYDGIVLLAPNRVFLLSIHGRKDKISLTAAIEMDQTIISLSEFFTSYKYIGWSHSGRLVTINTTEKNATMETAMKNDPWVEYNAACFVPKFLSYFMTLDKYHVLRVMDSHYKKELWKKQLNIEVVSMIPHPSLPAVIIGTMEGRMLFLTAEVPTQSIDFEDDEEAIKSKVNVKFVGDILIHKNPIDMMQVDPKTLQCVAVSNEEGIVAIVDVKNLSKLIYLDEATVEGRVLDVHLQGKTLLVLSTSGGDEDTYGDLVTYFKLDSKKKSLTIANVFNLSVPCSGIALAENGKFFFSMMYTDKHLGKFPLTEEELSDKVGPLSSVPSQHGLAVHMIQYTEWGHLALLGRDGKITIHSTDLTGNPEMFLLQHYQACGVIDAHIAVNGNILCVSGEGTLTFFQRKELLETPDMDKQIIGSVQKLKAVEVENDKSQISWSEKRTMEQKECERKKYEKEIDTITETVESMAEQVSRLLFDNDSLPEKDQLDKRQFELDVEEQGRQVAEGEDKVADLKMDLRAWTLARQQVSMKVKKEVWDKMEVPGRSLQGIMIPVVLYNFPLVVMSEEEQRRLDDTKEERRIEMTLSKDTSELRGQISSTNSARSSVLQNSSSPRQSTASRPTSPGSGLSSKLSENEVDVGTNDDSKYELLGSRSYLYVDIDSALLIPQLDITTQKQSQQQIILLKDVVRQLKMYFNKKFDQLFQEKEDAFEKISGLNERLDSVLSELRLEEDIIRPEWNSDEKPEMDLPEDPQEVTDVKVDGPNSGRTSAGGGKDHQRKRGVMMSMESGSGKNTIPPPLFMKIKKPESFTDEEVAAAESYEAEVQRMIEKGNFRKRELEAEKNLLQVQIEDIVKEIDKKVKDIFWLRISIDKCVLSEELKMMTLNRDLGIRDRLTREEEFLRIKVKETEEEFTMTKESLENGMKLLEDMKKSQKENLENDKLMDKNFKKEFPGLGFHQVDSLYKLFKKRPKAAERLEKSADTWAQQRHDSRRESKISLGTGSGSKMGSAELKTKTVQSALARMSNMFMGTLTIKGPKTSTAIGMSLEEMDRPVHCPENIDRSSWNIMCKLRREKIEMEDSLRSLAKEVAEAEIIVEQRGETHAAVEKRINEMKKNLEDFHQTKTELISNRQIQLMLKRGQVEVDMDVMEPTAEDCMIITDSVIDKLNDDIVRLGEAKMMAMQESKEYRKGSLHLRLVFSI